MPSDIEKVVDALKEGYLITLVKDPESDYLLNIAMYRADEKKQVEELNVAGIPLAELIRLDVDSPLAFLIARFIERQQERGIFGHKNSEGENEPHGGEKRKGHLRLLP